MHEVSARHLNLRASVERRVFKGFHAICYLGQPGWARHTPHRPAGKLLKIGRGHAMPWCLMDRLRATTFFRHHHSAAHHSESGSRPLRHAPCTSSRIRNPSRSGVTRNWNRHKQPHAIATRVAPLPHQSEQWARSATTNAHQRRPVQSTDRWRAQKRGTPGRQPAAQMAWRAPVYRSPILNRTPARRLARYQVDAATAAMPHRPAPSCTISTGWAHTKSR